MAIKPTHVFIFTHAGARLWHLFNAGSSSVDLAQFNPPEFADPVA